MVSMDSSMLLMVDTPGQQAVLVHPCCGLCHAPLAMPSMTLRIISQHDWSAWKSMP